MNMFPHINLIKQQNVNDVFLACSSAHMSTKDELMLLYIVINTQICFIVKLIKFYF